MNWIISVPNTTHLKAEYSAAGTGVTLLREAIDLYKGVGWECWAVCTARASLAQALSAFAMPVQLAMKTDQ